MIAEAILTLKDRAGSSLQAICRVIGELPNCGKRRATAAESTRGPGAPAPNGPTAHPPALQPPLCPAAFYCPPAAGEQYGGKLKSGIVPWEKQVPLGGWPRLQQGVVAEPQPTQQPGLPAGRSGCSPHPRIASTPPQVSMQLKRMAVAGKLVKVKNSYKVRGWVLGGCCLCVRLGGRWLPTAAADISRARRPACLPACPLPFFLLLPAAVCLQQVKTKYCRQKRVDCWVCPLLAGCSWVMNRRRITRRRRSRQQPPSPAPRRSQRRGLLLLLPSPSPGPRGRPSPRPWRRGAPRRRRPQRCVHACVCGRMPVVEIAGAPVRQPRCTLCASGCRAPT